MLIPARRLWVAVAGLAAAAGLVALVGPGPVGAHGPSAVDLLQQYVKNPSATVPQLSSVNLNDARDDLAHYAPKFLGAPFPKTGELPPPKPGAPVVPVLEQRRRNLVTFALDLAGANALTQGPAARSMIESVCSSVRRHMPPTDFDHAWQLAALALLEGELDPNALRGHLEHLEQQFPDEPRAMLAHALADEQMTAPIEMVADSDSAAADFARKRNPTGVSQTVLMQRALASYEGLLKIDALRPEASLRIAHLQIGLHHFDQALPALDVVDSSSDDPYLLYLSRLFRGLALEGLNRTAAAQAAYRDALKLGPGAHAATMALATSLFRSGHRDEADQLATNLVAHDDPTHDVWWAYYSGDFHLWGLLMSRVREYVK
jgi:tetratricopeptide (TPR) repeat protein